MLTKKQLNTLNEMLNDTNVIGKKFVQSIIWMNTTKTKYKIGDKVIFSDRKDGLRVYGTSVINFVGTIAKINYAWMDKIILYEIDFQLSNGETSKTWVKEEEISRKTTTKNLVNKVGNGETSRILSF